MNRRFLQAFAVLALLLPTAVAHAYSCSVSSPGFTTSYTTTQATTQVAQTYLTVSCYRTAGDSDPISVSYGVEANNGLYATGGGTNRANLAGNRVRYDTYRDSGCSGLWNTTNGSRIPYPPPGTMTLSGVVTTSVNVPFWGCITAGQTGATAGTHTDTVTISLYQGTSNTLLATGTFPVSIMVGASCTISSAPGTMTFNYTSFGSAANANTAFGATCTNLLPYSMSLDTTTGTLLGLNYSLALSAGSATGNGLQQSYSITGTMVAGQAGTCAAGTCSASASHTLTISY
jgi:spore coat protein U-like protein